MNNMQGDERIQTRYEKTSDLNDDLYQFIIDTYKFSYSLIS